MNEELLHILTKNAGEHNMCTAITYQSTDHYFGRNLDYEYAIPCNVIITPKEYPLPFLYENLQEQHYGIIGMGMVLDGYPLYYDATNECGLSIAGLNFPGNATYLSYKKEKTNIASFELIPWLLGQCRNLTEAMNLLEKVNIVSDSFRKDIPPTPLHWIIADQTGALTVEPTADGLKIYQNPIGVLTNNPTFPYHLDNLCNYMNVTAQQSQNQFCEQLSLIPYSRGMGGWGLPGDLSSSSRFVRAAFTKWNASKSATEMENITQFFHILGSVIQVEGCVQVGDRYEKTLYSSCCNMDKGIYYYSSYESRQITVVSMHMHDLGGKNLLCYPMRREQQVLYEQ